MGFLVVASAFLHFLRSEGDLPCDGVFSAFRRGGGRYIHCWLGMKAGKGESQ